MSHYKPRENKYRKQVLGCGLLESMENLLCASEVLCRIPECKASVATRKVFSSKWQRTPGGWVRFRSDHVHTINHGVCLELGWEHVLQRCSCFWSTPKAQRNNTKGGNELELNINQLNTAGVKRPLIMSPNGNTKQKTQQVGQNYKKKEKPLSAEHKGNGIWNCWKQNYWTHKWTTQTKKWLSSTKLSNWFICAI